MNDLKNINMHPILFQSERNVDLPSPEREFRTQFVDKRLPSVAAIEKYNSYRNSLITDVNAKQGKLFYERDNNNNYFKESLRGIHKGTLFSKMYYSRKNMNNLQNQIIYYVHKETGNVISKQSDNELLIVMRSAYLQHSKNPIFGDLKKPEELDKLRQEINNLNQITIDYIVPDIVSQILQYKRYLVDITQNIVPMPRQVNPSIKGTKEFRDIKELMSFN